MNDVTVFHEQPLTAATMRANVNLIQEVMKAVMQKDVHYGVIPGTPKPTLYKAGAEKIAQAFRIAPSYKIDDLSTPDSIRYRVTCIGTHQTSGTVMGEGMGECSSMEEKYKWRKAWPEEFKAAPEDRKRTKYTSKGQMQQTRTDPADVANTILKMACKRAQVAMTLNVTAASDIFTQDIEDLPEELRHEEEQRPASSKSVSLNAWDELDDEERKEVQNLVDCVSVEYDKSGPAASLKLLREESADWPNEFMKAALPARFSKDIKAGWNRVAKQEKASEPVISEAQKKRLEARVGELKLDREGVKAYCKKQFGKEHFAELTGSEYSTLDEHMNTLAVR